MAVESAWDVELSLISVLLKDFKGFAMDCTTRIRRTSQQLAQSAGRLGESQRDTACSNLATSARSWGKVIAGVDFFRDVFPG